jgi:hypothetical protein
MCKYILFFCRNEVFFCERNEMRLTLHKYCMCLFFLAGSYQYHLLTTHLHCLNNYVSLVGGSVVLLYLTF